MNKGLRTAILALVFTFPVGCSTPQRSGTNPARRLEISETVAIAVNPRERWGRSGIRVNPAEEYRLNAPSGDKWIDFFIVCGPKGYKYRLTEWYMGRLAPCKQLPKENWFALGTAVDGAEEQSQLIGTSWTGSFSSDGELLFFANDAQGWEWNNFGEVSVTITRVR